MRYLLVRIASVDFTRRQLSALCQGSAAARWIYPQCLNRVRRSRQSCRPCSLSIFIYRGVCGGKFHQRDGLSSKRTNGAGG